MASGSRDDDGAANETAGGAPQRRYANHVALEFSLSEVQLRFGQVFGPGGFAVHSWLVTSPVHLVSFSRAIALTIADYESRFGRIPDGADADPGT
jgi:Protein of unknown function (DUF3467)